MTAYRLEAAKVLTPEQKEKAKFYAGSRGFGPAKGKGKGQSAWTGCPGGPCGMPGYPGGGPKARGRR
jgi:hypothetical protein